MRKVVIVKILLQRIFFIFNIYLELRKDKMVHPAMNKQSALSNLRLYKSCLSIFFYIKNRVEKGEN